MKTLWLIVGLSLFAFSGSLKASDLSTEEFAYAFELVFESGHSLYEVDVPKEVYQTVTKPNLADMRVVNANFEVVPHQVEPAQVDEVEEDIAPSQTLPIFPIFHSAQGAVGASQVTVQTNDKGTIINVASEGVASDEKDSSRLQGYIIDASKIEHGLRMLHIEVDMKNQQSFFQRISLEASQDLKTWRTVDSGAVLANMEFQGERLLKDSIELFGLKQKYFRLQFQADEKPLEIVRIHGLFPKKILRQPRDPIWETVKGEPVPDTEATYAYDLGGRYPVDRVNLRFQDNASIARVVLSASHEIDGNWSRQATGTLFSIAKEGTKLENTELRMTPRHYRYWRLEVVSGLEGLGKAVPDLRFGWTQDRLRFLARGEGPFMIAFGGVTIPSYAGITIPSDQDWTKAIQKASIGTKKTLGGEAALTVTKPHPWKTWILWTILLAGVAVMGLMALKLVNSLKENPL